MELECRNQTRTTTIFTWPPLTSWKLQGQSWNNKFSQITRRCMTLCPFLLLLQDHLRRLGDCRLLFKTGERALSLELDTHTCTCTQTQIYKFPPSKVLVFVWHTSIEAAVSPDVYFILFYLCIYLFIYLMLAINIFITIVLFYKTWYIILKQDTNLYL